MKREIKDMNRCILFLTIRHDRFDIGIDIMDTSLEHNLMISMDSYSNEIEYVKVKLASVFSRYRELMSYLMVCSDVNDTSSRNVIVSKLVREGKLRNDYVDDGIRESVVKNVSILRYKLGSEEIEVQFSNTSDILSNFIEAHNLRVTSEMDDTIDDISDRVGEWLEYMNQFVQDIECVLRGLYGVYVEMMANREVAKYVLERSEDGLVRSVYHSSLADSFNIKVNVYMGDVTMTDYYLDMVYGYQIDDKGNVRGKKHSLNMIDMQNLGMGDSDDLCRLVNILEMMAYINDKITGYYLPTKLPKTWDYFGDVDREVYVSTSESVRELSQRFMVVADDSSDDSLSEIVGHNGVVCELDDVYNGYGLIIDMKASLLSKKVMASRVFDVGLIEWYYTVLLVAYAKSVFGKDLT